MKGKSGFTVWRFKLQRDDPVPAPWTTAGKKLMDALGIKMEVFIVTVCFCYLILSYFYMDELAHCYLTQAELLYCSSGIEPKVMQHILCLILIKGTKIKTL